ncbi:hypothetical protein [Nonomuraea wenchangensis]|uniref:hypothetical protein n=1 Tax=Nonomuraea wenchangensis TaxID=568860 RepID=UPI0037A70CA3
MATMTASVPSIDDLQWYLIDHGWTRAGQGVAGSLWAKESQRIGVPNPDNGNPDLVMGAIERIAAFERREPKDVVEQVRYRMMDRAELRAANDREIADTIPLSTASTILSAARVMFRSSATTAVRERPEINGNYSRLGDDVAKSAKMAHTKQGSFIIPILVPLSEPVVPSDELALIEIDPRAVEPFERRVTRTFAQSLSAVKETIIDPGKEPSTEALHEAVSRGVSREFCASLSKILTEPSVSHLQATFKWGEGIRAGTTIPRSVSIDGTAKPFIDRAVEKLRRAPIDTRQIFSGKIVALRLHGDHGEVAVSTIRGGRSCEIWVPLARDAYDESLIWHRDGRAVMAHGEITRDSHRRLVVRRLEGFHPLDEIHLPGL